MSSTITLYKHQQDAVNSIVPALSLPGTRATVNMACGTGKTLVSIKAAEALMAGTPDAKVIVFVPSLSLHDQLMTNWVKFKTFSNEFTLLPVASSGSSLGKMHNPLKPIILPNTTDVKEVINALQTKGRMVVFCTYQSAGTIKAALGKMPGYAFDLAIMDEAHRTAGHKDHESSSYVMCLDDLVIPIKRRLFLTATPRVRRAAAATKNDSESLLERFREDGYSMSDESLYGKVVHKYSFSEAVSDKKLSDFRIWAIMVSDRDIRKAALADRRIDLTGVNLQSKAKKDLKRISSARNLAVASVLERMHKQGKVTSALAFHQERASSMLFTENAEQFFQHSKDPKISNSFLAHVDGNTPQTARQNVMIGFDKAYNAQRFAMISNCAVFTEGVDVPELDTVVFVDNKTSKISIVQAVGRAVRLNPAKPNKIANIIIPIFCGDEDPEEAIKGSAFSTLYNVVSALRDNDNMEDYYSKSVRRQALEAEGVPTDDDMDSTDVVDSQGNLISGGGNSSITFVASESDGTVSEMSTVISASYRKFAAACEAHIVGTYQSTFERNIGKLQAYKELKRNKGRSFVKFLISKDETVGLFALGREMAKVRDSFDAGTLPDNERKAYEAIGFDLTPMSELESELLALFSASAK